MNPPITPKMTTDPDPHTNGGGTLIPPPPPPENLGGKRQRRPSVRLGDIGDQTYDPIPNRRPRKGPRSRNPLDDDERERESNNNMVSGWRKPKTKGVRSNWAFTRGDDDDDDVADDVDDDMDDEARDSPLQSLDNRVSDTDTRNNNNYWNGGGGEGERNGIRVWLNQLGLGRYAPVFEIHEVDDEVLPMLTIEDLRDMGINAVGSRRKMYCAIQKLSKGFS